MAAGTVFSLKLEWRTRASGTPRAYVDLRGFGGSRWHALAPPGSRRATADPAEATRLLQSLWKTLSSREEPRGQLAQRLTLGHAASQHLVHRRATMRLEDSTLEDLERALTLAIAHFGDNRRLDTIRPADVLRWKGVLLTKPGLTGHPYSPTSAKRITNWLGNLYSWVPVYWPDELPPNYNPVLALPKERSIVPQKEREFFEVDEVALLLEAARLYQPLSERPTFEPSHVYPLVAALAYTGARQDEVFGLMVGDVRLRDDKIQIRTNKYRRVKTKTSNRLIPIWPELRAILEPILHDHSADDLLFPNRTGGMHDNINGLLDRLEELTGLTNVRCHKLRHTYCATRLQTLDHGERIDPFTVAREMGHASMEMVNSLYGHVQLRRRRYEVVTYQLTDADCDARILRIARDLPKRIAARIAERDEILHAAMTRAGRISGQGREERERKRKHCERTRAWRAAKHGGSPSEPELDSARDQ